MTVRVLAVADEVSDALLGDKIKQLRPDLIVSCGDLPFEYLEDLVSRTDKPLLYVLGNHDPAVGAPVPFWTGITPDPGFIGPAGCINIDGKIDEAAGLRMAGLGGSLRYRPGPNQYSQRQMALRALRLEVRARFGKQGLDILLTHAAAQGYGDATDLAHRGFAALTRLVTRLQPSFLIHGHVQHFGPHARDLRLGRTQIINAIPYRLVEV